MVDCPLYNILAWQMKFFNLSTGKKKERTEIIRYQTRVTQQEFAIIKTKRHNRMSPPNLPYNDINLIYIDYNGMRLPNLLHNQKFPLQKPFLLYSRSSMRAFPSWAASLFHFHKIFVVVPTPEHQ